VHLFAGKGIRNLLEPLVAVPLSLELQLKLLAGGGVNWIVSLSVMADSALPICGMARPTAARLSAWLLLEP
jgi:hypothetical protein